jgi:hypothetical protein
MSFAIPKIVGYCLNCGSQKRISREYLASQPRYGPICDPYQIKMNEASVSPVVSDKTESLVLREIIWTFHSTTS